LEIEPDYVEAHNGLGLALAKRGRIDEAIAHYRRALAIRPSYAEAKKNLDAAIGLRDGKKGERGATAPNSK
jgi:Flp pilus assembly protein TadD